MKNFLRFLTRLKMYADAGMWYFPGISTILPIVIGVISKSITITLVVYALINCAAAVIGWYDVTHLKRIQYQNEVATKWNPFLLSKLKRR